jgi:hypothetical protein
MTTESKGKVDALVEDDHYIMTSELCIQTGIGKLAVIDTVRELGYRKVCATWVPKMLTVKYKTAPNNICAKLLL